MPEQFESLLERFERRAEEFYRETGYVAPGKDVPAEMGSDNYAERLAAWRAWNVAGARQWESPPPSDAGTSERETGEAARFSPGDRVQILYDDEDRRGVYERYDAKAPWPHFVRMDSGRVGMWTAKEVEPERAAPAAEGPRAMEVCEATSIPDLGNYLPAPAAALPGAEAGTEECGCGAASVAVTRETTGAWGDGPTVTFTETLQVCPACGDAWFNAGQADRSFSALHMATIAALTSEVRALTEQRDALRRAGAPLSNIAYNLAQRTAGSPLNAHTIASLDSCRRTWDGVLAEQHAARKCAARLASPSPTGAE